VQQRVVWLLTFATPVKRLALLDEVAWFQAIHAQAIGFQH
jgi:hypothetical protein